MMMVKQNKKKITALFIRRFVETMVALCITFFALSYFPFLVSISGEYFCRVSALVSSHFFVFTVLNASILLLSVANNAGQSQPQKLKAESAETVLRVTSTERKIDDKFQVAAYGDVDTSSHESEQLEVDFDKMMVVAGAVDQKLGAKGYRRTRSEILSKEEDCGCNKMIIYRRSETERCLEMVKAAEDVVASKEEEDEEEVVDELSNAEFNRIIEAFLEKQKRFHYQENKKLSSSIVLV